MRRKVEKKRWSEKDGQEQRKGMKRVCMKKQERVIGSKTLMTLLCSVLGKQQAVQFIIKIYIFLSHKHISYIYLCILNIIIYMQGHHKIYFFGFFGGVCREL